MDKLNLFYHWVMLTKLLLWVCLPVLSFNQDIRWTKRYNIGNVGYTASMSMLTLFESRYTLKGRYSIGNVGKTASMNMLNLFESKYTLKGRYSIGNVGKTAFYEYELTLFESRYTLKGMYNIGNVGKTASTNTLALFESRRTLTTICVKLSAYYIVLFINFNVGMYLREINFKNKLQNRV